ncbi:FUSC family protein [Arthrobacter sp. GCM10027362]|uniref:FUSC family protein n=1 Tax=Arthrobacter sp. GCM10027362 TaxID=3273379 RepID=UPI00362C69C6
MSSVMHRAGALVSTFVQLRVGREDVSAGIRICVTLFAACTLVAVFQRPDLTIFAVFGVFPVMFGRGYPGRRGRAAAELRAAVMVASGVLLGAFLNAAGTHPAELVLWETFFCAGACLYTFKIRSTPPGPFFGLFAFGATASAPTQAGTSGPVIVFVLAATAAILGGMLLRPETRVDNKGGGQARCRSAAWTSLISHVCAVTLAGLLAQRVGAQHGYWAMASAVVPLSAVGFTGIVGRGLHRMLGTAAGVLLAIPVFAVLQAPVALMAAIALMMFPTEMYMRRNYALALAFFTPLILAMTALVDLSGTDGGQLFLDRSVQTLMGAIVGLGVGVAAELALPRRMPGA